MPLAAATDGLFPQQFKQMSKTNVPAFGIVTPPCSHPSR
jgi:hypothetical protein